MSFPLGMVLVLGGPGKVKGDGCFLCLGVCLVHNKFKIQGITEMSKGILQNIIDNEWKKTVEHDRPATAH